MRKSQIDPLRAKVESKDVVKMFDDFATFEHQYLLQNLHFSHIKVGWIFTGLIPAMGLYFVNVPRPDFVLDYWRHVIEFLPFILRMAFSPVAIAAGLAALFVLGIALCPIPPWTENRTRFTHYVGLPRRFRTHVEYIEALKMLDQQSIVEEKVRHCYALATNVNDIMRYVFLGMIMAGISIGLIIVDSLIYYWWCKSFMMARPLIPA